MTSIGETLRQERLRRNLQLDQISRELKISRRLLEAIEDEEFSRLPGGVFTRSFVVQYARYLNLDTEEISAELRRVLEPRPESGTLQVSAPAIVSPVYVPRVEDWEQIADHRRFPWSSTLPALALVVVVMLVCSGIYTWWQRSKRTATAEASVTAAQKLPNVQKPPAAAPTPDVAAPMAAPSAQPASNSEVPSNIPPASSPAGPSGPAAMASRTVPNPGTPGPGVPVNQADSSRPPRAAAIPSTQTPSAPVRPVVPSAPGQPVQPPTDANATAQPADQSAAPRGAVHVEVQAQEPVWILGRGDGKYLFSGTLEANQSRALDAKGNLELRIGNAGGLVISLNGKPIGPVGPKGQVRILQFTPGGFHIVAPSPKPATPPDEAPDPL
jgi:cytoskeleton protein RodZ